MTYSGTRVVPFASQDEVIAGEQTFKAIDPATLASAFANLPSAANDTEAAAAGVAVGHLYRTSGNPANGVFFMSDETNKSMVCVRIT